MTTTIATRTPQEAVEAKKEQRSEVLGRPYVDGQSLARIAALREQIKGLPPDTQLPTLSTFDGFEDWLRHPITLALLARAENKREEMREALEKMKPCASCRQEHSNVDKEFRGWTAGGAELLDAVAISILSGQQPRCGHEAPASAPDAAVTPSPDDRRGCG